MSARAWPPFGFFVLMLGFGVRLDSDWQTLGWMLLVTGAGAALLGLRAGGQPANAASAFVQPPGG